jgi:hypothetical protein
VKVFTPGGPGYRLEDISTGARGKSENLGAELARDFNKGAEASYPTWPHLDAVNIVDESGNLLDRMVKREER